MGLLAGEPSGEPSGEEPSSCCERSRLRVLGLGLSTLSQRPLTSPRCVCGVPYEARDCGVGVTRGGGSSRASDGDWRTISLTPPVDEATADRDGAAHGDGDGDGESDDSSDAERAGEGCTEKGLRSSSLRIAASSASGAGLMMTATAATSSSTRRFALLEPDGVRKRDDLAGRTLEDSLS